MQAGTREDSTAIQMQAVMVITALNEGYYVSIADDLGTKAAFCKSWPKLVKEHVSRTTAAGFGNGYRSLDSIRAVKQSGHITGISSDPIITMSGYSSAATVTAWVSCTGSFTYAN
jgi:hypothetical protein